jgi:hypothetical protein
MKRTILRLVAVLALINALLLPVLAANTMVTSSADEMAMQCPSCHLASDCSNACSLIPVQSVMSATRFVPAPLRMEPATLNDSYASILPKPPIAQCH